MCLELVQHWEKCCKNQNSCYVTLMEDDIQYPEKLKRRPCDGQCPAANCRQKPKTRLRKSMCWSMRPIITTTNNVLQTACNTARCASFHLIPPLRKLVDADTFIWVAPASKVGTRATNAAVVCTDCLDKKGSGFQSLHVEFSVYVEFLWLRMDGWRDGWMDEWVKGLNILGKKLYFLIKFMMKRSILHKQFFYSRGSELLVVCEYHYLSEVIN